MKKYLEGLDLNELMKLVEVSHNTIHYNWPKNKPKLVEMINRSFAYNTLEKKYNIETEEVIKILEPILERITKAKDEEEK